MKIKLGSKKRLNIYFTILDAFLNKINEKLYIKIVWGTDDAGFGESLQHCIWNETWKCE